jgi:hypothetical protein
VLLADAGTEAIKILLRRPWFLESWVLLECAFIVGKPISIQIGGSSLDFDTWSKLAAPYEAELVPGWRQYSECFGTVGHLNTLRAFRNRGRAGSVLELSRVFLHFKTADPREKIFSFLGLLKKEFMPIDY